MAALQNLARALRENFTDNTAAIQLSEILQFIENYTKAGARDAEREAVPKNANPTRKNASPDTRQTTHTPAQERQTQNTQATTPSGQKKGPSYADAARKAARKTPAALPKTLPKSLQNSPKPPTTIRITLRNPLKETPMDLISKIRSQEGDAVATLIKAIRPLTKRQALIYPKDEKSRETLLGTSGWLASLQAETYSRDYFIVVHGIDKTLDPQEVVQRLQEQNIATPGLFIGSRAQWIGKKPIKTGSMRIGLKCPVQANRLIQQGLVLDYEIKRVYQYKPVKNGCNYRSCNSSVGTLERRCLNAGVTM